MYTMTRVLPALSFTCVLALAACASHPQHETTSNAPRPVNAAPEQHKAAPVIPRHGTPPTGNESAQTPAPPGEMVGVASCDQYLSTYKACHRAAGVYSPDQIDSRYEAMRNSLIRDAQDPAKRAILDNRCRALSRLLTDALHGKSCNAAPAPASSRGS